jgi:hypothetical protein
MEPDIPATVKELKQWMKQRCFNLNSYSIQGNTINEGFGIDTSGGVQTWYYVDSGMIWNTSHQSRKLSCMLSIKLNLTHGHEPT